MLASALTAEEGKRLLQLARAAVVAAVNGDPVPRLPPEQWTEGLRQPLGAFVTLYYKGELRGCIGRMQYDHPLCECVVEAAQSSALYDPRFTPVTPSELADIRVSLSVLDVPRRIESLDEFDVDQHGIVMENGPAHGVFLPKVAREYGWDRETTLMMLCRKIGLPDDAWKYPGARFQVFRAIEFAE